MKRSNLSALAVATTLSATMAVSGCQSSQGDAAPSAGAGHASGTHPSGASPKSSGGGTSDTTPGKSTSASSTSAATTTQAEPASAAQLQQKTRGQSRSATVQVTDKIREAASWDTKGNLWFWRDSGHGWQKVGSSRYPRLPGQQGGSHVKVASTHLSGSPHAIYIVDGPFTGDSTGNDLIYAATPDGRWGTATPHGTQELVPTGKPASNNPAAPGLWLNAHFAKHLVMTESGNLFGPNAAAGDYPLVVGWAWRDGKLQRGTDNAFSAAPDDVNSHWAGKKLNGCPDKVANGRYVTNLSAVAPDGDAPYPAVQLSLRPAGKPASSVCPVNVDPNTPVTVWTKTTHGSRWGAVPAWMLVMARQPGSHIKVDADQVTKGWSPLAEPDLREIDADLGTPFKDVPASVTVSSGKVTQVMLRKS